ncbi:hypothetical protein [Geothrix edaphica]|uniref:Tetratricopeptide repeat protein n=1 Tax=Geothrix edaphica TaxID=2927976 RepID=A0ABQ5PV52_9BACT|nr:hypothetical protein [Geothrix edaphica]GLH65975.1 hypothetical protein GETHED_03390 [Geothrix edaphica]
MSATPRIILALQDPEIQAAMSQGASKVPKAVLASMLKTIPPKGGIRPPNPNRDTPEKVVSFLIRREHPVALVFLFLGLLSSLRSGELAENRRKLVPNLPEADIPDPVGQEALKLSPNLPLSESVLASVRDDLRALAGKSFTEDETKVLLILEHACPELKEEVESLLPLEPGSSTSVPRVEGAEAEPLPESEEPSVSDSEESETSAVPSEEFSALDKLLFRAAVDSVAGVDGSLPPEEVADLVEELIYLNTTRTKSYFHRGFLHALTGPSFVPTRQEENQERRAWEWAGKIIALARYDRRDDICLAFDDATDLALQMAEGRFEGPAKGAMPHVAESLLHSGRFQDACTILKPELVRLCPGKFIPGLIREGRHLVRSRRVEEAKRVLGKGRELLAIEEIAEGCPPELLYECERRWGQVLRAQGAFREARSHFEHLLRDGGAVAELRTDMALCAAKKKWLDDVALPIRNQEVGSLLPQLEAALPDCMAAIESGGVAPGAAYMLGIVSLLHRNQENEALQHLEMAYEMALSREEVYPDSRFFNQLCMALSVAILLAMDESQFDKAHDLIHRALDDGRITELPLDLFKRAIEVIRASSHPACLSILEDFEQRCPEILEEHLRRKEFLESSPAVLKLLEKRAQSKDRTPNGRWRDLEALLSAHLRSGNQVESEGCLAYMEELALTHERLSAGYLSVLEDPDRAGAILEDFERLEAIRLLHQVRGQRRSEGLVLAQLARLALGQSQAELATEYLDLARACGLNAAELDMEHRWANEIIESTRLVEEARQPHPVSVLLVGGNEVQERYDHAIKEHFRRQDRHLTVEFLHPAWSSNWNFDLEDVKRRLPGHDALVVMRFNRTQFGRHVRRLAGEHGKLWFACTGHGRDSIIRAVDRAAGFLRSRAN